MTELKSPEFCAECGSQFTREIIEAGGSRRTAVTIRGHQIPIPGLYTCTGCDEAIKMGARQSGVTWEAARDYLDDIYGLAMVEHVMTGGPYAAKAMEFVREAAEVSILLDSVIHYAAQPGGLDFIPECTGHCGGDDHGHPRQMAHLN